MQRGNQEKSFDVAAEISFPRRLDELFEEEEKARAVSEVGDTENIRSV